VFTKVTLNNFAIWDVTPCGSCKDRGFGGTHRLCHQGERISGLGMLAVTSKLLVTANVLSTLVVFTLMMEEILSSEKAVLISATRLTS
jgi:hypothetical protein